MRIAPSGRFSREAREPDQHHRSIWLLASPHCPDIQTMRSLTWRRGIPSRTISPDGAMHLFKRNEPLPLLVPQSHSHAPKTLKQRNSTDGSELRMIPQCIR